jgi:radical SAM superfamily enzyme YgiQ (UPF0313 family)
MKALFRMIIPAFPEINIFTNRAKRTTALGPIMVATAANKLWDWQVEVIDENNYKGPRDSNELPDHAVLEKERSATAVGFYCGLTSTIERVWQLAGFYQSRGAFTVAGGWHAHYCSEETLKHNIDLVVHGDGEIAIQQVLSVLKERNFENIPGISYFEKGQFKRNDLKRIDLSDLNDLPFPDFNLLRFAKIRFYPISRIRGCSKGCEFCSVKGKPRWSCPEHFFDLVVYLVETIKAKRFFIVDDRLEENLEGTTKFFNMIADKYGSRLRFTVQTRLEIAENTEFLKIMSRAGVRILCVGCESPIDEDLKAMNKGYTSDEMLGWIETLRRYFWIHAMYIVGYPSKRPGHKLSAKETVRRFKKFIRKSCSDSVQVMLPGPAIGTGLYKRLKKQGRLFPLSLVPWSKYDGTYVCFEPDNMNVRELQAIPLKLMSKFYNPWSFVKIPLRIIVFPGHCLFKGWKDWFRGWDRDIIRAGGHLLIRRWKEKDNTDRFIKSVEEYMSG